MNHIIPILLPSKYAGIRVASGGLPAGWSSYKLCHLGLTCRLQKVWNTEWVVHDCLLATRCSTLWTRPLSTPDLCRGPSKALVLMSTMNQGGDQWRDTHRTRPSWVWTSATQLFLMIEKVHSGSVTSVNASAWATFQHSWTFHLKTRDGSGAGGRRSRRLGGSLSWTLAAWEPVDYEDTEGEKTSLVRSR